jgi:hypothetical protein
MLEGMTNTKLQLLSAMPNQAKSLISGDFALAGQITLAIYGLSQRKRPEIVRTRYARRSGQANLQPVKGYQRLATDWVSSAAASDWPEALRQRVRAAHELAGLSALIVQLVEPVWRFGERQSSVTPSDDELSGLHAADLFVASRVIDFLRQVFPIIANLAAVAMTGVLAMMLALSVYPFVQRDTMVLLSWVVLLTVIAFSLASLTK